MQRAFDTNSIIAWFEENRRDLPWRDQPSPYDVLVSEIMLQQTQVSVVIPYYLRWMERFPTIEHLARATVDEVIKTWEGLGYYSRARNLHLASQVMCEKFGGQIPTTEKELSSIKGLGPYTIGAIRSFAFHQKTSAIDGNVLRVIARYFQVTDDIAKESTKKMMRRLVENFLPEDKHWIVNEALIELGALVCKKKPSCQACPLKKGCLSFLNGKTTEIPFKSTRISTIPLNRFVAVVLCENSLLVKKGGKGKIMHDLHEFPFIDTSEKGISLKKLKSQMSEHLEIKTHWIKQLPEVTHSFTKYRAKLSPHLFSATEKVAVDGYSWKTIEKLQNLAFSSGHKKIFANFIHSPTDKPYWHFDNKKNIAN